MKILLVEGDPLAAFELTGTLEDAGHQVVGPASSNTLAISLIAAEQIDLALLSVGRDMNDQVVEIAEALRLQQGTWSVFFRGDDERADNEEGKPASRTVLVRGLEQTIHAVEDIHDVLTGTEKAMNSDELEISQVEGLA